MKSAVVCIAKNEDRYLDEWIKYHLKLGFSEIFVYQNNWRYPTGPYDDPRVHLLEMDGYKMMNPCYNGFIQEYHNKFDFVMFIDVDEFLVVNTGEPLADVLESYLDEDCVYVNWRIFGDNGRKDTSDGEYSCVKRFTRCDDRLHRLGKNILNFRKNGNRYSFYNPHIVLLDGHLIPYSDSNRSVHAMKMWDAVPSSEQRLELFHYKNKTLSELMERKYGKDDALFGSYHPTYSHLDLTRKDFEELNQNKIENRKALDFMYGDVK